MVRTDILSVRKSRSATRQLVAYGKLLSSLGHYPACYLRDRIAVTALTLLND